MRESAATPPPESRSRRSGSNGHTQVAEVAQDRAQPMTATVRHPTRGAVRKNAPNDARLSGHLGQVHSR